MFRAYRQANSGNVGGTFAPNYPYAYDQTLNTFGPTGSLVDQIRAIGATTSGTVTLSLISALEDQLPGFSANWEASSASGDYPMDRSTDDNTYAGIIGPKISSKSVAVGTIEVSTALRRTEIEDIKANTGMISFKKWNLSLLTNYLKQFLNKLLLRFSNLVILTELTLLFKLD